MFGTNPKFLVRSAAPDTSKAAAYAVDTTHLESLVYAAIRSFGASGCISDEVQSRFEGYPYSSITARFRALIDKGYIEDTGERRPGRSGRSQRVMRAVPQQKTMF